MANTDTLVAVHFTSTSEHWFARLEGGGSDCKATDSATENSSKVEPVVP